MNLSFKKLIPHLGALVLFIIVALAYFSPVLQGKQILQSDIVQYTGMAKQHKDFKEETGEESYWTNAAFGGMPTYQLGAHYPHNYIKEVDLALRFLPRPADYLFLYFIGFYVLMMVMKVDFRLAIIGALAFGFSTYLIIILGVGHNAKAHAIAYMPMVLAGIFLTFRGKYLWGFLLTAVAMALEIGANHFQMTYYLLLLVIIIGIAYLIDAYKKGIVPHFFKSVGVMALAVGLALGMNATNLLATKEYAAESTRGKSDLTITPQGLPKEDATGLSKEYITEYSYGILETFNLFIPRFMGGGNTEDVGTDSAIYDFLRKRGLSHPQAEDFTSSVPAYWGDQPIVAAPAYIGAVVLFLAVLGIFLIRGRLRWWLVSGSVLALLLSWGKNLEPLTNFFIDYVPLYDKFRAVSSIQVIIELCMPVLAVFALFRFFNIKTLTENKKEALKYGAAILGGISLFFVLFGTSLFDFSGDNDSYYIQAYGQEFMDALKEDRKSIFLEDSLRSLALVLISAAVLWFFLREKLRQNTVIFLFGVLILFDLVAVDRRYVNNDDFVAERYVAQPFEKTPADEEILKDDAHFRVYDATTNPFSSGRASFFHNALGGYHAAKPGRIQDLADFYLNEGEMEVFNMLNVKYIIQPGEERTSKVIENPYANGNAWFVEDVLIAETADEEILALGEINTQKTAVVHSKFEPLLPAKEFAKDSLASIKLIAVKPNYLHYEAERKEQGLAVFSEVYYPHGWNAYINGKLTPHFRADYVLRAVMVPAGFNKIEFKFEPEVVETGSRIALGSTILLVIVLLGAIYLSFKRKEEPGIHDFD